MGRPKAPHVDHPYVFSVSQLETFDLCPRKWAFEKIDKLEREPNEFAELGDRVHTVLEKYLKYGKTIDTSTREGKIAFPGLKHLPLPRSKGMRVEEWFVLKFGVAVYRGLKDVEIILKDKIPKVMDHKSTRNFKWKKSQQELKTNLQAGIYAADCMVKTGIDLVEEEWIYYKTEGKPKAEPVKIQMTQELVEDVLTRANTIAVRMVDTIKKHKRALDVIPNYTACNAYGGCAFRDKCKPTPSKILKSIMAQKKEENMRDTSSAFLEDLRNRNNKKKSAKEQAEKKIKLSEVESIPVNPPERETVKRPRPPAAKEVNGEWESPIWDEVEFQWVFPGEQKEAKKKKKSADITKDIGETKKGVAMAKNKGREVEDLDDDDDDEDDEPKKKKSSKFASKDDDDEDDEDEPKKKSSKASSKDDEGESKKKSDAVVAGALKAAIKELKKALAAIEG